MRDDVLLLGLKNIGPTIAARLAAVGIRTIGDLRSIGAAQAYKRVKAEYPRTTLPVCYYLYSLQGALDGVHWDTLSGTVRNKLVTDAGLWRQTNRSRRPAAEFD